MCKIEISSVEEEKEIEKNLRDFFLSVNYDVFTCEGLSVNDEGVNFFERFEVDEGSFTAINDKLINNDSKSFLKYFMSLIVATNLYDKKHYKFIVTLMKRYDFVYNIILHTDSCSRFLWIAFKLYKGTSIGIEHIDNCKVLSKKIFSITKKEKNKFFREKHYLKCIDKCLRDENTPYPGNFDGLVYNIENFEPQFIIEYSKVDWVYKSDFNKDITYHLNWYCLDKKGTGWKRDMNRWKSLKDLSCFLNIPVYIVWWGTRREEYTIGELKDIQDSCYESINIIYEQITKRELFHFFHNCIKE